MNRLVAVIVGMLLPFIVRGQVNELSYPETYVQYAPAAAYLVLPVFGAKPSADFVDRSIKAVTAYAFESAVVLTLKHVVQETRPDGSAQNSFPSGHTATAFTGAGLMCFDYGPIGGGIALGASAFVGTMRVVHQRHWWWDAAAGASIGFASAWAANALCPIIRKNIVDPVLDAVGLSGRGDQVSVCPAMDPVSGTTMAQLSIKF